MRARGPTITSTVLVIFALILSTAETAFAQSLLIQNATVFDGTGASPRRASVLVENGRITEVAERVAHPRGIRVLNAKGKALLPGFIDVHTHWTPSGTPSAFPEIAARYVLSGVTTINDFHSAPEAFDPKRLWLTQMASPHVNYAARVSTPGGHGADWGDVNMTQWITTPQSARLALQELLPYRPDLIKAFTDGWRYGSSADNTSMNEDALTALVVEAHRSHLPVLTHTVTLARAKIAARAGVDALAHAIQDLPVDDELIALMKQGSVAYAPTLAVYEPKPEKLTRLSPERIELAKRRWNRSLYNLRALRDAGVTIALGTDAGMEATPHGESTLRELELLIEAGLTPPEALLAGTAHSASVMKLRSDRGTIEPGKRADLVIIEGEPWRVISDVRKVHTVLIDGKIVAQAGVLTGPQPSATSPAATPAQRVVDDFERPDGRSTLDTLRINSTDGGMDRSQIITQTISRSATDRALSLTAWMSKKEKPVASIIIPLSRGSVVPVDASAFRGVRLEVRGEGPYMFTVNTVNGRWTAEISADAQWREAVIPFSAVLPVGPSVTWTGRDLLSVEFGASRAAGTKVWGEIDNVQFY